MKSYKLIGFYTITFWGGGVGFKKVIVNTTEKGLKELIKNPLQDFIQFGVESVNYVSLNVYEINKYTRNGKFIISESIEPIKSIKRGKYNPTPKQKELLFDNDYSICNW